MSERDCAPYFLLSGFAEFYELVAELKLAIHEGRLSTLLQEGDKPAPGSSMEIAALISGRLGVWLQSQLDRVARESPPPVVRAHRIACYAMAALADEIFVLELNWTGRTAWLDVLLEHRLFQSRIAGREVFDLIEQLLATPVHNELHVDLAAVFLLALQLGFKGRHRGPFGEKSLHDVRGRLHALVRKHDDGGRIRLAFPQSYQHLDDKAAPARLAPMTPWYIAGGIALAVYLAVSTSVWLYLTQPFLNAIAGS